jgi:hypothetical protein
LRERDGSRGWMDEGKGRKAPRDSRGPAHPFSPDHQARRGILRLFPHAISRPNKSAHSGIALNYFSSSTYGSKTSVMCADLHERSESDKSATSTKCPECWHDLPRMKTFGEGLMRSSPPRPRLARIGHQLGFHKYKRRRSRSLVGWALPTGKGQRRWAVPTLRG